MFVIARRHEQLGHYFFSLEMPRVAWESQITIFLNERSPYKINISPWIKKKKIFKNIFVRPRTLVNPGIVTNKSLESLTKVRWTL